MVRFGVRVSSFLVPMLSAQGPVWLGLGFGAGVRVWAKAGVRVRVSGTVSDRSEERPCRERVCVPV